MNCILLLALLAVCVIVCIPLVIGFPLQNFMQQRPLARNISRVSCIPILICVSCVYSRSHVDSSIPNRSSSSNYFRSSLAASFVQPDRWNQLPGASDGLRPLRKVALNCDHHVMSQPHSTSKVAVLDHCIFHRRIPQVCSSAVAVIEQGPCKVRSDYS